MDSLKADLEEATSELLNVPGAQQGSGSLPATPRHGRDLSALSRHTFSASSRIEPIRDEQEQSGNARKARRGQDQTQDEQFNSASLVRLPLQGIVASERQEPQEQDLLATLDATPSYDDAPSQRRRVDEGRGLSSSSTTDLFRRATSHGSGMAGAAVPLHAQDVWLNAHGERVLNGRVVGRLGVAFPHKQMPLARLQNSGESEDTGNVDACDLVQPTSRFPTSEDRGSDSEQARHAALAGRDSLPGSQTVAAQGEMDRTIALPGSIGPSASDRLFDYAGHGQNPEQRAPTFFEQSFPSSSKRSTEQSRSSTWWDSSEGARNRRDRDALRSALADHDHRAVHVEQSLEGDRDDESGPQGHPLPPPMTKSIGSLLETRPSSPTTPVISAVNSDPVTLHGNKLAEGKAHSHTDDRGVRVDPTVQTSRSVVPKAGVGQSTRPPRLHRRGSSRSSLSRGRPGPSRIEASVLERAAALFTTPLAPDLGGADTGYGDDAWVAAEDGWVNDAPGDWASEPSPGLDSASKDSASSLYSLPVSSIAPTHSSGARRSSLVRTGSMDSGVNTPARRHRSGDVGRGPSEIFARDVKVRGWSEVGARSRGHVDFDVVIWTLKGVEIRVHRRYRSFVVLRQQLVAEAPDHGPALPRLPPKDALHKYSARHLEQRRLALTRWLQAVMLDPRWGGRQALREWLVGCPP